jgi:anti-sigma regulatory factor (Ser/Thr protein kinase)
MNGTSAYLPSVSMHTASARGRVHPNRGGRVADAGRDLRPMPVPHSWPDVAGAMSGWPLGDLLELAALPGAVPCARYHCRQVLWEWHLTGLVHNAELLVSELVSNAITAARSSGSDSPVRLSLLSDTARVVIMVWDASPHLPVRAEPNADAETGRGLLLVETISDQWGAYPTPPCGKSVWALVANP